MFNTKDFISSQEGKIFLAGITLFFTYLISIAVLYLLSVEDAKNLLVMSVTNLFFGRAAGISYGFTVAFSDTFIIIMNIAIELITVMIIYPLFVLSWNKSLKIDFLRGFFINVKKQRIKYKSFFDKYGKYGLFIFVWFPFWMTGPVVGAIVGFLIGIKHYYTMAIVLFGTSLAIVIWTYFLKEVIVLLNQLSAHSAYIVLGLFLLIAVALKVFKRKNK